MNTPLYPRLGFGIVNVFVNEEVGGESCYGGKCERFAGEGLAMARDVRAQDAGWMPSVLLRAPVQKIAGMLRSTGKPFAGAFA